MARIFVTQACAPFPPVRPRALTVFLVTGLLLAAVPALAKPALERARHAACATLRGAGDLISAVQHDDRSLTSDISRSWAPRYNRFAVSGAARDLRGLAVSLRDTKGPYTKAQCRFLNPLLDVARRANIGASVKVRMTNGSVLIPCRSGQCIPRSIAVIADRCDFEPLAIPVQSSC